jgi:hypothetical protein
MKQNIPKEIEKKDIEFAILNELNCKEIFKDSLKYVLDTLPNQELTDFEKINWRKEKNYNWCVVVDGDLSLLVRQFKKHFTFYMKLKTAMGSKCGCFTFYTDIKKTTDIDFHFEKDFFELNNHIQEIVKFLKERKIYWLWNDYSLPRPNHVEILNVWDGDYTISNLDKFVFAMEELTTLHRDLFAENEVFNYLKNYKEGDEIEGYTVTQVHTELKNGYYHGVGLSMADRNGEISFQDVYSITSWYLKDFFKD